jgi:lipopolysaccharide export system protein LptA
MIRRLVLLAVLIATLTGATAGAVKITSDKFVSDESQHVASFTGDVVVTRNDLTVWADQVVVSYGTDGPSSISKLTARGHVKVKSRDQTATGEQAVYDPKTLILHLTGHVMVTSGKNTIASPDLIVDLNSSVSTFSSSGGGRVSGVFNAP